MGNYLAIDAWSRGLDCLVLTRKNLETLCGLTKLTKTRVEWIREDIRRLGSTLHLVMVDGGAVSVSTAYR